MSEEPFGALLMKKVTKNKVIKKGKNDEEGDMEDGDSDGDNYSDCHCDKHGNGIVYAMISEECGAKKKRANPCGFVLLLVSSEHYLISMGSRKIRVRSPASGKRC